jgi:hypothetical protein
MGAMFVLLFLAQTFVFIYTGYTAWEWIKPEHFTDYFRFAILWAILEWIAFYAVAIVIGVISALIEANSKTKS